MEFISLPTSGELIDSNKKKFWRWEQKKKTTLATTSGNVGADGRESSKKFPSKDKVEREIESKPLRKTEERLQPTSEQSQPPDSLANMVNRFIYRLSFHGYKPRAESGCVLQTYRKIE